MSRDSDPSTQARVELRRRSELSRRGQTVDRTRMLGVSDSHAMQEVVIGRVVGDNCVHEVGQRVARQYRPGDVSGSGWGWA
eukprot:COSAG01_NODE_1068_length_11878_cov_45.012395_5_plen_81_part_00